MAALNDIYEVKFFTDWVPGVEIAVNVMHYKVTGLVGVTPTETEIANQMYASYQGAVCAAMSVNGSLDSCSVQRLLPLPKSAQTFSTAAPNLGVIAGDPMPTMVCGIITKRTGLAGRAFRGRWYSPFIAETQNDDGMRPTAAALAQLNTLAAVMTLLITTVGGAGSCVMQPVIFHRSAGTTDNIQTAVARTRWATQRRRNKF